MSYSHPICVKTHVNDREAYAVQGYHFIYSAVPASAFWYKIYTHLEKKVGIAITYLLLRLYIFEHCVWPLSDGVSPSTKQRSKYIHVAVYINTSSAQVALQEQHWRQNFSRESTKKRTKFSSWVCITFNIGLTFRLISLQAIWCAQTPAFRTQVNIVGGLPSLSILSLIKASRHLFRVSRSPGFIDCFIATFIREPT